jgi:hypothetical protein
MAAGRVEGMSINDEPMDAASWNAPVALSRSQVSLSSCRPQRAAPTGALTMSYERWSPGFSGQAAMALPAGICAVRLGSALRSTLRRASRIRQRCAGT